MRMDESQSFYVRVDHRDIEGIEAPTKGLRSLRRTVASGQSEYVG